MQLLNRKDLLKSELLIPILICSREQVVHLLKRLKIYLPAVNQVKFTSSVAISSLLGMIHAKISSVFKLASPFLSSSESNLSKGE